PALDPPDVRGRLPPRGAARRPAAVRALRGDDHRGARRADAGGPAAGQPGGQQQPGRREQGHLGAGVREVFAVLSRVADYMFWMSRYLERAESVARLLN